MAKSGNSSSSSGVSALGLLGVLFVGLKLTGYINWSWWWVTAPFWGSLAVAALIIGGSFSIIGAFWLYDRFK